MKRGGFLKRSKELSRGGFEKMKRKAGVKRVNRDRMARRYTQAFGPHAEYIRTLPCAVASEECEGRTEAAHVRSRGAGGTAKDLVGLCHFHHRQQHDMGVTTFQRTHSIDLVRLAADLWEMGGEG